MSPWLQARPAQPDDGDDGPISSNADNKSTAVANAYKLSAVVMHVGGPAAGHYYAYVRYREPAQTPSGSATPPKKKNSRSRQAAAATAAAAAAAAAVADKTTDGGEAIGSATRGAEPAEIWVKLDDHRVTKVSEAEVLRDAFGGGGGVYKGPGAELQGLFGQVNN